MLLPNLFAHSLYPYCILKCQQILCVCSAYTFHVPTKKEEEPDPGYCEDYDAKCGEWAKEGECEKNPIYMVTRKFLCTITAANGQLFSPKQNRVIINTCSQHIFPVKLHRMEKTNLFKTLTIYFLLTTTAYFSSAQVFPRTKNDLPSIYSYSSFIVCREYKSYSKICLK